MTKPSPKKDRPAHIAADASSDILWGAPAIAHAIGRSPRAAYHLLENDLLPARKVGGVWSASRQRLLAFLAGDAA